MSHRLEPLGEHHDLEGFESGSQTLDEWLRRSAWRARGQGTRTYVLIEESSGSVVGYFAIAPHLVAREGLPARIGRGAPREIPALLLAKLALDRRVQGGGLGSALLVKALERIVEAGRTAGGKVLVVDAIDDEARTFYERHDFQAVPGNRHRLVMKLSVAARALGIAWP